MLGDAEAVRRFLAADAKLAPQKDDIKGWDPLNLIQSDQRTFATIFVMRGTLVSPVYKLPFESITR